MSHLSNIYYWVNISHSWSVTKVSLPQMVRSERAQFWSCQERKLPPPLLVAHIYLYITTGLTVKTIWSLRWCHFIILALFIYIAIKIIKKELYSRMKTSAQHREHSVETCRGQFYQTIWKIVNDSMVCTVCCLLYTSRIY